MYHLALQRLPPIWKSACMGLLSRLRYIPATRAIIMWQQRHRRLVTREDGLLVRSARSCTRDERLHVRVELSNVALREKRCSHEREGSCKCCLGERIGIEVGGRSCTIFRHRHTMRELYHRSYHRIARILEPAARHCTRELGIRPHHGFFSLPTPILVRHHDPVARREGAQRYQKGAHGRSGWTVRAMWSAGGCVCA